MACPLTNLTKKSAPNCPVLTNQCKETFQTLKRLLCSAPVLKGPDFNKPFILQTDASERGIGAVLSQLDDNQEEHPIAFFSK